MAELSLVDEVREFLDTYGQTKSALDKAVYVGFARRLLNGRSPAPFNVARARAWMEDVRAKEPDRFREAAALIRANCGYIIVSPAGRIEVAPEKIPRARLHRMMVEGWLVPTGDTLLPEVYSQSYKLSSLAQESS